MIDRDIFSTSTRHMNFSIALRNYITYDKQKSKVLSWGKKCDNEDEDTVQIDISEERLNRLFKKGKDCWNQDDLFLFKAVSDYIRLSVENLIEKKVKDTDALHYIFVVPSEWKEEIREVLIRPIFVRANLISKDDHKDRLLFCTDVESLYYFITRNHKNYDLKLSRNTITTVICVEKDNEVSIKLDSILIGHSRFGFSNSLSFPKLMASNLSFLTTNDVKNGIREFLKTKFSFDAREETIQNIMEDIERNNSYNVLSFERDRDTVPDLNKPFITRVSIEMLDRKHRTLLKSIRPIDICAEISKNSTNYLKPLFQNDPVKEYSLLKLNTKRGRFKVDKGLLNWSGHLLEYNRISFGSNYIVPKRLRSTEFDYSDALEGAVQYMFDALQDSDIYSKPRILSTEHSSTSSSIFLKSKPDAIMNIDISLESTALSFSLLDENGFVKEIWNDDDFVPDTCFSEETTLNIENSFIKSVKEHLKDKSNISSRELSKGIENILNFESRSKDLLASTQQQVYIKAFVSTYMIYINDIISRSLPKIIANNANLKIGYYINIDNMLLKRLFGMEDNLRDVIYASNLVQKDDSSKKLRIATHAEGLFLVIQQSFNLQFPLKSFFLVAQLYENYVQLTLNQVVTESGLENEYQEAIIMQEETIPIPNIYDILCRNMWNSITEDSSLILLCDTHKGYDDNELLEIFTLENQAEFTNNLKEHISKNILNKTLNEQKSDTAMIHLSTSCNCEVCLTENDITEISFRPVLQDIISLVFTSLINKQLFGKYRNIQYVFHLIRFNYNPQFQHILMKILEDETDHFLYEERIDTAHYTLPKLSNQLLRPVLQQEPFSYKAFQVGTLYHVYSETYGLGIETRSGHKSYKFKNKMSDSKITSVEEKQLFALFKKEDRIDSTQIKRVFYLSSNTTERFLRTQLFKLGDTIAPKSGVTNNRRGELEYGKLGNIGGPFCLANDFKSGLYSSFIISVLYEGHSSSIYLALKKAGGEIKNDRCVILADPMTLARF
ncbi:hypothetical protein MFLAVUS_009736 [Mucor flavus]|uniref:Uncharacterized protein n=1 Tax=Mucor flavus TaxID=439312 RepID=A0ABP9ZAR8_9FUNG